VRWPDIRERYRPLLEDDSTDDELFAVLQGVLAELNDSHIDLVGGGRKFQSGILGQMGKVTHMGDTTAGALASPIARVLPNGWLYRLPLGLTTDHNDICFDGQGITPEVQITNDARTIESGTDQVLEAALGRLSI
jgi:hypothetical protein